MNTLKSYIMIPAYLILFIACDTASQETEDIIDKPNTEAIAIYNQAYNENFDADKIDFILEKAANAYVLIDPFQDDIANSIAAIKANSNEVGAYISIGTGENWRDDFETMKPFLVSKSWDEWDGEYFVNTTTTGIIDIMKARIDKIALWGCDWVEFDNMDWIDDDDLRNKYNFQATKTEGITYFQELCNYVHQKGMKCMAKNTVENASIFDGVLYESYTDEKNWWDESGAQSFINAGKLVIINHYNEKNCDAVYEEYKNIYGNTISYICEDANMKKYKHYNQK